jgi:hypothetical protein
MVSLRDQLQKLARALAITQLGETAAEKAKARGLEETSGRKPVAQLWKLAPRERLVRQTALSEPATKRWNGKRRKPRPWTRAAIGFQVRRGATGIWPTPSPAAILSAAIRAVSGSPLGSHGRGRSLSTAAPLLPQFDGLRHGGGIPNTKAWVG